MVLSFFYSLQYYSMNKRMLRYIKDSKPIDKPLKQKQMKKEFDILINEGGYIAGFFILMVSLAVFGGLILSFFSN